MYVVFCSVQFLFRPLEAPVISIYLQMAAMGQTSPNLHEIVAGGKLIDHLKYLYSYDAAVKKVGEFRIFLSPMTIYTSLIVFGSE